MQQTEIFPPRFFFFSFGAKGKAVEIIRRGLTRDNNKDLDVTEGV